MLDKEYENLKFRNWLKDFTEDLTKPDIPDCLAGYENSNAEGGYSFPCTVCGEDMDIFCEPHEFDPDMHYCGRSSGCCP